jgi:hypothetical protein
LTGLGREEWKMFGMVAGKNEKNNPNHHLENGGEMTLAFPWLSNPSPLPIIPNHSLDWNNTER